MPNIGVMTTGAGVTTTLAGQAQADAMLVLGDVDTANPLRGIQVEIDGTPYLNIQNNAVLCAAFAKWQMESISGTGVVGVAFKIATGRINKNTTYRLTNDGATTPAIRVMSDSGNGVPIIAATKGIVAGGSESFRKFAALFIDLPANVSSLEMEFADGEKQTWQVEDADARFSLSNQSEANGRLGTATVIDNSDGNIKSVRVNATTAVTVLVAKIPNSAFKALRSQLKK